MAQLTCPPSGGSLTCCPRTMNEDDRSSEVVWSTGARVRRQPYFGEPFDEELSMDPDHVRLGRLNERAPLPKDEPSRC